MSRRRNNSNVIKYIKKPDFNIGFIIFAVIFIYVIASLIIYATKDKTTIYEVDAGSLSQDDIYNGFIIRNEEVIDSKYAGTINYFLKNHEKAGTESIICTVDETGRVAEIINKNISDTISSENMTAIRKLLSDFTVNYNNNNFNTIYTTRDKVKDKIYELQSNEIQKSLDDYVKATADNDFFHKIVTEKTGIVSYTVDGYENTKEDDIDNDIFDYTGYKTKNLIQNTIINTGDPIYKLVKDDTWYVYIKLSETTASSLQDAKSIKIRFVNSDLECKAGISIIGSGDNCYGKLTLKKYMVNFLGDRFVNIKLIQDGKSGLKIPSSAVFKKNFYTIPLEYLNGTDTFVRKYYSESGELKTESVQTEIYGVDKKYYYVSTDDFTSGDMLMKADSDDVYIVGTLGELDGVYCINKGYSVFKRVDIIDSGNEYCIVKRNTKYGLSLYDHIVLNYKTVKEDQLIN